MVKHTLGPANRARSLSQPTRAVEAVYAAIVPCVNPHGDVQCHCILSVSRTVCSYLALEDRRVHTLAVVGTSYSISPRAVRSSAGARR